jgi:NitT/TauT family transport system substrate-binding protein
MSRRVAVGIVVLVIAVAAVVVLLRNRTASAPASNGGSPSLPLTIAQAGDFYLYAPLYIAVDQGFFSRRGANVTIVSTGGDEKTWAAVLSGDAQFGIADPTFVAIAAQRGQAGKILATIVNGVPFWGITKNPRVPTIESGAGLNGFSVATFPSPSTAYTLQKQMFDSAKIAPNIRQGGFGTLLALVESNQADIALELEPNVSQALTKGYRIVYSLAALYGDFTITGLTATPDYLRANPAAATAVVRGLADAMTFLHERPDEATAILAKRFPEISRDVADAALRRVLAAGVIPRAPSVSKEAWEKALRLRVDAGDLKPPPDAMTFIDNSFAVK